MGAHRKASASKAASLWCIVLGTLFTLGMLALVYEGAPINSSIMTPPSHRDEPPRGGYGGSAGGSLEAGLGSSMFPAGAVGEPEPKPEPEPGSGGNGGTGGNPTGMDMPCTAGGVCELGISKDEPPRGGYGGSAGGSLEAGPRSSVLPAGAVGEPEPKPEPKPEPEPGSGGNGGTGGNHTGMSEFWINVICPFAVVTGDVNFGKCRVFNAHILFLLHSRRGIGLGFGAFRSLQVVAITKSLKAYIEIDNSKMSY